MADRFAAAPHGDQRLAGRNGQNVADLVVVAEGAQAGVAAVAGVVAQVAERGGCGDLLLQDVDVSAGLVAKATFVRRNTLYQGSNRTFSSLSCSVLLLAVLTLHVRV